ncbi:MAG: PepSY-associated TM helix domain-containing protein [Parvularculaceae bacterium]
MTHETGNSVSDPKARASRAMQPRIWWRAHQWAGLNFSILISFIFMTGTLAVFDNEIDWLLNPAFRVDPKTVSSEMNWESAVQSLAGKFPAYKVIRVTSPIDRGFAAVAIVQPPKSRQKRVYIHPETGSIQGVGGSITAEQILHDIHRKLMLPTGIGTAIVSSMSLMLLTSLSTSFYVYRRWWRGFFRPIRLSNMRTALGDVHRLAGVWSLLFIVVLSLTSSWYFIRSIGLAPHEPRGVQVAGIEVSTKDEIENFEQALDRARRALPDLSVRSVLFPKPRTGVYSFYGQDGSWLVRDFATAVYVNAKTFDVELVRTPKELNFFERVGETVDPVHFGSFAGVWSKIAWFCFGLLLTGMSLTGAAIYVSRLTRPDGSKLTFRKGLGAALAGMGRWKYLTIALLAACAVSLTLSILRF